MKQMTKRLSRALTKLYTAFHNGELDAMDCKHCAVGNMCDNNGDWLHADIIPFGYKARISEFFENKTGYSRKELSCVESFFLYGNEYGRQSVFGVIISDIAVDAGIYTKQQQKEQQFKGLCAVVEYLCKLDNYPNPMDLQSLFEYDDNGAINELVIA